MPRPHPCRLGIILLLSSCFALTVEAEPAKEATLNALIARRGPGQVVLRSGDTLVIRYPDFTYTVRKGVVVSMRPTPQAGATVHAPTSELPPKVEKETAQTEAAPVEVNKPLTGAEVLERYGDRVRSEATAWSHSMGQIESPAWEWSIECFLDSCKPVQGWPDRYRIVGVMIYSGQRSYRRQAFEALVQLDETGAWLSSEFSIRR